MLGTFIPDFPVTGLSADGKPFGMHGDIMVFVDKAVPGDIADVNMIKNFQDNEMLASAKIIALKRKSPLRIDPFCKHFNYCGGCQWQNISYEDQLKIKQEQVEKLFTRFIPYEMLPIIPSAKQRYYRNRVNYAFSNRRWMSPEELKDPNTIKRMAAGFLLRGKNDRILNVEECYLSDPFSIQIMHTLRDEAFSQGYSFYDIRKGRGFLRSITIRFADNGQIMVIVAFGEEDREKIHQTMNFLKEKFPQITSLYYVIFKEKKGVSIDKPHVHFSGNPYINYTMEDLSFRIGPNSFYQTNSPQAYELYKVAREFAGLNGDEIVYDLYTGTGTIALFVSHQCKKVIGIEGIAEAIEDAKTNAMINKVANASFIIGDLKETLNEGLFAEHGQPDVIITDPPRAGMHIEGLRKLRDSGAKKIVYISCNPLTQARDLRLLSEQYRLVKSQPVDMFPQTSHVENVVLMVKK